MKLRALMPVDKNIHVGSNVLCLITVLISLLLFYYLADLGQIQITNLCDT